MSQITTKNSISSIKIAYSLLAFFSPLSGALLAPVLSLFFTVKLGLSPIEIGIYFVILPVVTIFTVQRIGALSDHGWKRSSLIALSGLGGMIVSALLFFEASRIFIYTVLILGFALSGVGYPQIFAAAREFSVHHLNNSVMFTTWLRVLCSLAWVMGPPIAYYVATGSGFKTLFGLDFLVFGAVMSYALFFQPEMPRISTDNAVMASEEKWWHNRSVMLLFIGSALLATAYSSYITSMPLFITQELRLDVKVPGYVYAISAFLEVPVMILTARLAGKISIKSEIVLGGLCLLIFLLMLPHLRDTVIVLVSAALPAIYMGVMVNMGMQLFQRLLPNIPGQATSLFVNSNTVGQILGGGLFSIAQSGAYSNIYYASAAVALLGFLAVCLVEKDNPRKG